MVSCFWCYLIGASPCHFTYPTGKDGVDVDNHDNYNDDYSGDNQDYDETSGYEDDDNEYHDNDYEDNTENYDEYDDYENYHTQGNFVTIIISQLYIWRLFTFCKENVIEIIKQKKE